MEKSKICRYHGKSKEFLAAKYEDLKSNHSGDSNPSTIGKSIGLILFCTTNTNQNVRHIPTKQKKTKMINQRRTIKRTM